MARYATTVESALSPADAFAYMADFANARHWDPSVLEAAPTTEGAVGTGAAFDLVVRFGGRTLPLRYEIVSYEEPRQLVIEAKKPSFISRDTITVSPSGAGSTVHYDALLVFNGVGRVLDPVLQLIFNRTGDKAAAGMRAALNP